MKHNKFWLFLSLIPFLTGCGKGATITHTFEELDAVVKTYDYDVNYTKVHFKTEGHVCGLVAYENEAKYNQFVPTAAENTYTYDTTLTDEEEILEDVFFKDKKRKEFIKKRTFVLKDELNGGASQTSSCFLRVPLRLYSNDKDDIYGNAFESFQYKTLLERSIQDEHNGGKIFDVMQTVINEDKSIRFFCENNYLVQKIVGVDINLGEVLIRGRFNSSYTYDKDGYLKTEEIQTVNQKGSIDTIVNFKVNYSYE